MSKTKNKTDNKTEKVIAAEKEQFSKQQRHNISKSVTSSETPLKEKYVRNIILGTYREAGATTFWSYTINLPLSSNALISWKFCNILHKVLRDGHSNAVRDSHRFCRNVKDMGTLWGNLHDRYGHIVALSAKFLCLKMEFHVKHKGIPGNLEVSDENLEREAGSEINKLFDMTQELLDYLDAGLKMAETVLRQLDANGAKSNTPAGQCRLAPLIPIILDCSFLYHFSVRLLFKLHSRVPPDSLLGHRERFRDLFNSLTQFFDRAREMEFFKLVIQVPDLPDSPPNFLRAAALGEYVKPVVVMPNQELPEEDEAEPQAEYSEASQIPQYYLPSHMGVPGLDPKETDLNTMRKELEVIKPELQLVKIEAQRCVTQLKSQVNSIEAELEEQRTHKQMALVDNEHLRMEVQALRSSNTANSGEQADRVQAAEVRFCQLKERHAELVTSHAELLKKNADTVRVLCNTQHSLDELLRSRQQMANDLELLRQENLLVGERQRLEIERVKRELQERTAELAHVHSALGNKETEGSQLSGALVGLQTEREVLLQSSREQEAELSSVRQQVKMQQCLHDQDIQRYNRELQTLRAQLQQQLAINAEQKLEIERLRRELDQRRAEVSQANSAMRNQELLSGTLAGLQAERDVMLQSAQEQEAELSSLRQQVQTQQSSLNQDRDRNSRELDNLKTQLQQQVCHAGELRQRLQEEQFCLLQCAVVEAEGIVLDAVAKLEDPLHVRCVSSPDYLVNRAEVTLSSLDKMQHSHMVYLNNMNDASGLLRAVTHFSHLAADTIVNGAATSHTALTDQADCLADSCRDCATQCLQFLKDLKLQATIQRADPAAIRNAFQRILTLGKELRPKAQDVLQEELGDMVDKEMMATSTAIEEAVLRMDEILNQARKDTSGIKLEVNQSIIGSCSDLMKAIHMLVTAATDLQKDIVEGGRGATSVKEFYAKNSRWTEGLISASKAVGWGATVMLDSADRVITDQGKYEELIVCSHEIAASTAQLVAASKVKAERNNKKLYTLQQASRHVNDMAAVVVTSTKHGQQQITEKVPMDFSGISRIKLKTEEMESQVKVLELENQLEQQRVHLCELRKRHYELQGNGIDQELEDQSGEESFPPPPPPILLPPSIQLSQAYSQTQPYLNTQSLPSPIPSMNPFAQAQSSSLPQSYTTTSSSELSQLHTPTQSYMPTQSLTPYMASEDDSFFKVQSYSSQPFSHTPNFSQPQPFSQLQSLSQPQPVPKNTAEAKPATAKKHSIFQKSGTLLKNAFRRGEAGTGES